MEFDLSLKQRKPKYREVSSRFLLSPTNSMPVENGIQSPNHNLYGIQSPNHNLSPLRQKPRSSTDTRKLKSLENSGFIRGLWPSASSNSLQTPSSKLGRETLADHLGNERLNELEQHKNHENSSNPMFLIRQRSSAEFTRFENEKKGAKENHKPIFGSSIRYTGKFRFPRRSSASSSSSSCSSSSKSSKSDDCNDNFVPGRLSVDETALRKRNAGRKSDYFSDLRAESESEQSDVCSGTSFGSPVTGKNLPASYMAPTVSSRMSGVEVPSKYMQDLMSRSRRCSADSSPLNKHITSENSPKRSFTLKNTIKRSNTGIEASKWASSPGRSSSPTVMGSSNFKPPTSPSRAKAVGNFLTMGLELLKGKKTSSNVTSPLGLNMGENVHQLRLLHNGLVQWRYANARVETINQNVSKQAESNLISGWDVITKLQQSVRQKKVQIEKEKLEMKLDYILPSQIKALEAWGKMERQHLSSVNMTKDCLHSVVCRVPLTEGAKVAPQSASMALRDASDVTSSIYLMLSDFPPVADKTATIFAELAEIVTQEKLLLEECLEHFKLISELEVQEKSLKCYVMQLKFRSELQSLHQEHQEMSA